jgi:hypothetical protein
MKILPYSLLVERKVAIGFAFKAMAPRQEGKLRAAPAIKKPVAF